MHQRGCLAIRLPLLTYAPSPNRRTLIGLSFPVLLLIVYTPVMSNSSLPTYIWIRPVQTASTVCLNGTGELVTSSTMAIACSDGIAYNCRFQHVVVVGEVKDEVGEVGPAEADSIPSSAPPMYPHNNLQCRLQPSSEITFNRGYLPTWLIV